jgi:hypothetical protein
MWSWWKWLNRITTGLSQETVALTKPLPASKNICTLSVVNSEQIVFPPKVRCETFATGIEPLTPQNVKLANRETLNKRPGSKI